jgi:trypanothione synthetase/amidase
VTELFKHWGSRYHFCDATFRAIFQRCCFYDRRQKEQQEAMSVPTLADQYTPAEGAQDAFELKRITFIPKEVKGDWLDLGNPAEAKFVEAFGMDLNRSRLEEQEANYYTMNKATMFACDKAGHDLHKMFIDVTKTVLASDALMERFGLPQKMWSRIRKSFETQPYAISGRFDFVVNGDGTQLKTFEYNADSASTLLECAVVQEKWANSVGITAGSRSCGSRIEDLAVAAWEEAIAGGVIAKGSKVHFMVDDDKEEQYTALFLAGCAQKAGLTTELLIMFDGLQWKDGVVCDTSSGTPVKTVWKTWAWETAISKLELSDAERGADYKPKDGDAVWLCDVILGDEDIKIFEPMWKLIPSNKAILPMLWEAYPNHPNLLRTEWTITDELKQTGYARKPIVGRCGRNVSIFDSTGEAVEESAGEFSDRDLVYQELFQLPKRDDYFAILGGWMIGGRYGGTGVREDKTIITNVESPFSAIRVIE